VRCSSTSTSARPFFLFQLQELGGLDGVLSFSEMAMPLVARLAERLGLPGNPPGAVDAARDKHATRTSLAAAGLPTPRNFLITSPRQLQQVSAGNGSLLVLTAALAGASSTLAKHAQSMLCTVYCVLCTVHASGMHACHTLAHTQALSLSARRPPMPWGSPPSSSPSAVLPPLVWCEWMTLRTCRCSGVGW